MKRTLAIVIFALSIFTSACSQWSRFVVVNDTAQPLAVEYVLDKPAEFFNDLNFRPFKVKAESLENWFVEPEWIEVPQSDYQFDEQEGKVKVTLKPGESVQICGEMGFNGFDEEKGYQYFSVKSIQLSGDSGEIVYSGKKLYKQFRQNRRSYYLLNYGGSS